MSLGWKAAYWLLTREEKSASVAGVRTSGIAGEVACKDFRLELGEGNWKLNYGEN